MKLFLIKTALFAGLLIAAGFAMDFMITAGLKKSGYGEYQTWNDIFSSKINADVIITGSSRAWVHISPEILDSVLHVNSYNLGFNGQPFSTQYVRYKVFEKYNKKPRLIIQGGDNTTLYRQKEAYEREYFLPYAHEDLIKPELKNMRGFTECDLFFPSVRYHTECDIIRLGVVEFLNIYHFPGERYKGYWGDDQRKWDGTRFEKILLGDSLVAHAEPEIVQLCDSFLNDCKEQGIQVILVFTPQYFKATEFTKNKEDVLDIYRSFSKKYDIPFLDYSKDSLCYDTTYFYNAMHLNKKGAELFSLKLANDIKALNLYRK
jgi:hypothetical protein